MTTWLQHLHALHRLDAERRSVLAALHQATTIAAQRQAVAHRLKYEREEASDLHWALDETEHRLRFLGAAGENSGDVLAGREIAALRLRQNDLEDQVLHALERIDRSLSEQGRIETAWQAQIASGGRSSAIQAEAKRLETQLATLNADRQDLLQALPNAVWTLYLLADNEHTGDALALVETGCCTACNAPALRTPGVATRCTGCHRLLVAVGD